jgi:hypothetical protein
VQDLAKLFAGIEYMRYLEGEKHLVYVSEASLDLPRMENDKMITGMANDARITIDTIQTGGIGADPAWSPRVTTTPPIPRADVTLRTQLSLQTLRNLADLTGGVSSLNEYTRVALDRLDRTTRFEYLIGYYPAKPARDGRYRQATVKVNRPDVTVYYRHGYYAADMLVPLDRHTFVGYRRVLATANYSGTLTDIKVTAKASYVPAQKPAAGGSAGEVASSEVAIEATIHLARLSFTTVGNRHVAALDVSTFTGDRRETVVGESWQRIDLSLTDEAYRRYLASGIPYTVRVPVTAEPRVVKVVVYDYNADLLGSAVVNLVGRK